MFGDGETLPPAPPQAHRVIDSHVACKIGFTDEGEILREASDIAVFRMAWARQAEQIADGDCLVLREFRQIPAPLPGWK